MNFSNYSKRTETTMRPEDLIHFCTPSRLILGCGARAQLPQLVQRMGWRHGVLVTDKFFSESTPWVREYVDAANALGVEIQGLRIVTQPTTPTEVATECSGQRVQSGREGGRKERDTGVRKGGGCGLVEVGIGGLHCRHE